MFQETFQMRLQQLLKWRPNQWQIFVAAAVALMVIGAAVFYFLQPPPIFSHALIRAYPATLLVPAGGVGEVEKNTPIYDANLKLLTYTVDYEGAKLVISEQPTPEAFTDIPEVYNKLTASMKEYTKFDVDTGTVHLTKPDSLKGKQAAVLNTKGTLMLVKPDRDLTEDQWRRLFAHLDVKR